MNTKQELQELSKGFDIALDVIRPPGANYFFEGQKNCLSPVTWVKIIGWGAGGAPFRWIGHPSL